MSKKELPEGACGWSYYSEGEAGTIHANMDEIYKTFEEAVEAAHKTHVHDVESSSPGEYPRPINQYFVAPVRYLDPTEVTISAISFHGLEEDASLTIVDCDTMYHVPGKVEVKNKEEAREALKKVLKPWCEKYVACTFAVAAEEYATRLH